MAAGGFEAVLGARRGVSPSSSSFRSLLAELDGPDVSDRIIDRALDSLDDYRADDDPCFVELMSATVNALDRTGQRAETNNLSHTTREFCGLPADEASDEAVTDMTRIRLQSVVGARLEGGGALDVDWARTQALQIRHRETVQQLSIALARTGKPALVALLGQDRYLRLCNRGSALLSSPPEDYMTMERWSQFIEQWSQDDGAQSRDEFAELVANNLTCWREADMEEVRRAQKHVAQEERARRSWTQRPLQRK